MSKYEKPDKHVTKLFLQDLNLHQLPDEMREFSLLQEVDLSGNRLTQLPSWIGNFRQLRKLVLSGNRLHELPAEFGQLVNLVELDLGNNELKTLTDEIGKLTHLKKLNLQVNHLTTLPKELWTIKGLVELHLSRNPLTCLSDGIGRLTSLTSLSLREADLSELPNEIGELRCLLKLNLSANRLHEIPVGLGNLSRLSELDLSSNRLRKLPPEISGLTKLIALYLSHNELESLPEEIGELEELITLYFHRNKISSLPVSIGRLDNLVQLGFDRALQFPPPKVTALGTESALRYIREYAANITNRYEVKLVLLGNGNEGKTCLSRALRGLPFEDQSRTKGIEIESCKLPSGSCGGEPITFRIWDFEGQEISHQSHLFFLTEGCIYLIVVNSRHNLRERDLKYWSDTIRYRANNARVLLVFTHCEDLHPIDVFNGYETLKVDNKTGQGIEALKDRLVALACDLKLVPQKWPKVYHGAETRLNELGQKKATIDREELAQIFNSCEIDPVHHLDATQMMANLGIFTHFPDNPALKNFIILNPQWLTRSISLILEHPKLVASRGELDRNMVDEIWDGPPSVKESIYLCMREFELCCPLDARTESSLVPLRLPPTPPTLPWTLLQENGIPERRLRYCFNQPLPAGMMSRFIVKVYHYICRPEGSKGIYWRNGVFLQVADSSSVSEALCLLDEEKRFLQLTVRSRYPQNLVEQLHGYFQSVLSFYKGFNPTRHFGCLKDEKTPCEGFHSEERLHLYLQKHAQMGCHDDNHWVNPFHIVDGYHELANYQPVNNLMPITPHEPVDQFEKMHLRLDELIKKLECRDGERDIGLRFKQVFRGFLNAMDQREASQIPSLYTLIPENKKEWKIKRATKQTYRLRFYCEHGEPHRGDWSCLLELDKKWWRSMAPYLDCILKVLRLFIFIAKGLPVIMKKALLDVTKDEIALMQEVAKFMPGFVPNPDDDRRLMELSAEARWALEKIIKEQEPSCYERRDYGGLKRVLMPDGKFRWFCSEHDPYQDDSLYK